MIEVDRDGTELRLVVQDDGKGVPDDPSRRSGLTNIAERAAHWHGTCDVDSAPGRGTTVTWRVPCPGRTRTAGTWRSRFTDGPGRPRCGPAGCVPGPHPARSR
ncbi:hypothetical protein GCM10029964_068800 [Kibdelosporangium lantanae]